MLSIYQSVQRQYFRRLHQLHILIIESYENFEKNCNQQLLLSPGPTICYDVMEQVEVPAVSAKINGGVNTNKLFEVSPNSGLEQIIEVELAGLESGKTASVLTPSDELVAVRLSFSL